MANKPETTFITSVNRLLPIGAVEDVPLFEPIPMKRKWIGYEKMNNPYSSGTADSWYSGKGGDLDRVQIPAANTATRLSIAHETAVGPPAAVAD